MLNVKHRGENAGCITVQKGEEELTFTDGTLN